MLFRSVLGQGVPIVDGELPVLAQGAEHVGRRSRGQVAAEVVAVGPHVAGIFVHEYGKVALQHETPLRHRGGGPADLLVQLRGVEISAATPEGKLEGSVLGVESQTRRTKDGDVITLEFLNLATGSGIKSFPLAEIRDIQILDANLKDEMKKALEVLAKSRDRQKRTVSIRFAGKGEREVKITYVLEAPVWKTSYRLLLADKPKDKSALHGWAIVENTTDSDWKNVNLSLVSGRPISFIQIGRAHV